MLLLALAILVWPLLKAQPLDTGDHRQRNIAIARQRLAELKQQLQGALLSQAEFDEQYAELQLMLNDDLQAEADSQAKPQKSEQGRWMVLIVLLLLPAISLLFYQLLGETNALAKAELQANQSKAIANIGEMVGKLEQRLRAQPDDVEGWLMLGRSYSYLQQYGKAAAAFAELYRRQPDNLDAMLQYANNLAMARNGRMAGEPAQLIEQVLQRDPNNANALWLAGMAQAEQGDYKTAEAQWTKLLTLLPADSESVPQVKQMLAQLQQEMAKTDSAAPAVQIAVSVDIAPQLKTKLPAQATVFVYAQAVDGPKMPLAIVRQQMASWPLQVNLGDAQAMQPGFSLASLSKLRIVARISQSGQAMAQAGDLMGSTELSAPFADQLATVSINQEVK